MRGRGTADADHAQGGAEGPRRSHRQGPILRKPGGVSSRPAIRVVSLNSCSMTDTIVAEPHGDLVVFRWSWGDLVGTSTELRKVAEIVMRVLDIEESPILPT